MVTCPVCNGAIDVDEEEVDEGDPISCDECGADLKVTGTDPLELGGRENPPMRPRRRKTRIFLEESEEEEPEEDWK